MSRLPMIAMAGRTATRMHRAEEISTDHRPRHVRVTTKTIPPPQIGRSEIMTATLTTEIAAVREGRAG